MSDSSPFDDAPTNDYEEKVQVEEEDDDDPFSNVPQATSHNSAPSLENTVDYSSSSSSVAEPEQETPLSIWERERSQILRERQSKADAEKSQQQATAREEISKFYADAEAKLEKNKKINRADEKNYRADNAAVFANGSKWEKVNKLVNLAPKSGEKPGTSRVERYRKLLTQLKAEKAKAK